MALPALRQALLERQGLLHVPRLLRIGGVSCLRILCYDAIFDSGSFTMVWIR